MEGHDLQRQTRHLQLTARRLVTGTFAGQYRSVFRGRGLEFHDFREYHPGDDSRDIDWRVTARLQTVMVRSHVEERQSTIWLAVDTSASLSFPAAGRQKSQTAREVAAILAMAAIRNNDRVGLVLFSRDVEHLVLPGGGQRQAMRLFRDLARFRDPGAETRIGAVLEYLNRLSRQPSTCFLISDLYPEPSLFPTVSRFSCRHDLVGVAVSAPLEYKWPATGIALLRDVESGELIEVDCSHGPSREQLAARWRAVCRQRRELFCRAGADLLELSTSDPIIPALCRLFRQREKRP